MEYAELIAVARPCPFCAGKDKVIRETRHMVLTYALAPYHKHHLLIVPKRHVEPIGELTSEERQELWVLQQASLKALHALGYSNVSLLFREGALGRKSVAHAHFHVIPAMPIGPQPNDDMSHRPVLTQEEIDQTVADIQKVLPA